MAAVTPTSGEKYDVVIVGAGVAGALLAWRLGDAGLSVALIEAGARSVDRAAAVSAYGVSASKSLGSPYAGGALGPEHQGPNAAYYDQIGPEDFLSTYERIAGGSTWHWLGHTPRLLPNDFQLNTVYKIGVDWPIRYADLEPWYCAGETALGVAGDDVQWANVHGAYRSQPFPMPPIWPSWSDAYVGRALNGTVIDGRPVQILATPAARNSRPYDGRPPCAGNASCIPICPIGAKYDGFVHVEKALKTGKVTLIAKAVATKLEVGEDSRIRSVEYKREGQAGRVNGTITILSANAIESAKLLLMSAGERAPNGVANSSGQVGRNLMDHMQKSVYVQTRDPVHPFRGPPSTSGIETFRDGPFRSTRAAMRFSLNNDGFARRSKPSPITDLIDAVNDGLFGRALRKRLFDAVSRQLRFSLSTETLPDPNNRVTLSDKLDSDGLPRPRISFNVGDYTRSAFGPALTVIDRLAQVLGASVVEQDNEITAGGHHYSGAGHIMGTCRMGSDKSQAVADANCRAFDHDNLYIVGSSLWPSSGTANPTLTVAAIALRAAAHIAEKQFGRHLKALVQ